jgi:hypothetical protein
MRTGVKASIDVSIGGGKECSWRVRLSAVQAAQQTEANTRTVSGVTFV